MYIEQAYKALHEGWRYVLGIIIIFIFWQGLGILPLLGTVFMRALEIGEMPSASAFTDPEVLGISSNAFFLILLLSFVIGLLGLWIVVKYYHNQKFKDLTTTRKKVDWKRIFFSFLIWVIISVITIVIDFYIISPADYQVQFQLKPFLILAAIGIFILPLQTSFEEYLFRGYLMQGIGIATKNRWLPLVITSVLFGSLHYFNPEVMAYGPLIMFHYIGTGFFLGILVLMDEGLELSLGFHAANNMIAALLVTSDWSAFQTNAILKDISEPHLSVGEALFPLLITYPLLLLVFSKKYGWRNWKNKLFGKVVIPETNENDMV